MRTILDAIHEEPGTPTTEQIREYIRAADRVTEHMFPGVGDSVEAFDRWLAAHDAEVLREAADALDGTTSGLNHENPLELSYINCTRIDAQELRHRADRIERGAPVKQEGAEQ